MRPTYESPDDLAAEQEVADIIARRWSVDPVKMPMRFRIDYALFRDHDRLVAWAEVRCRSVSLDRYPTCILSVSKVKAGLRLAEAHCVPFLFIVRWTDAIGWIRPSLDLETGVCGRWDRNDPADRDQVVIMPINQFKLL